MICSTDTDSCVTYNKKINTGKQNAAARLTVDFYIFACVTCMIIVFAVPENSLLYLPKLEVNRGHDFERP